MKRKKWSELEEQTLLSKYSDHLNSGALSKLKTREKKFRPIADHVNSLHHLRDPIAFPFKWSWRDVSIKVQNMRHRYLGVKQKIRASSGEFNWADGEIHWENFLKYKQVFGDVDLPDDVVKDNPNATTNITKNFGDADGIPGYEIDSDDEIEEAEQLKSKRGFKSGKKLRMVGARVLELRDVILHREKKRREREWTKETEEQIEKRDETEMMISLKRELESERRRRMQMLEKWEEEEMKWRERMVEMQMQHEKQMMQMHADSCQNQLQILGVLCQIFGSGSDGLGSLAPNMGDDDGGIGKPNDANGVFVD